MGRFGESLEIEKQGYCKVWAVASFDSLLITNHLKPDGESSCGNEEMCTSDIEGNPRQENQSNQIRGWHQSTTHQYPSQRRRLTTYLTRK